MKKLEQDKDGRQIEIEKENESTGAREGKGDR